MKKLSCVLCLLLCLCLAAPALAFDGDPNLNAPGQTPICKEPVKLTVGIAADANVIDFETNTMTKMLEEEGNFDLSFVTYASSEMMEKLNVMIQVGGDDLPDVIMFKYSARPTDSAVYNWALNGAIVPLTEYIKNSSYYLPESIEKCGTNLLPLITMPDGEIYYLPAYAPSMQNEYNTKNWVYQPWLDKLGLSAPTDAESLYTVLKAFKEKDPNGNGKADEIPYMANASSSGSSYWRRALLSMFCNVGDAANYIAAKDGTLYASYTTEEYREGLRYIKKLFDEGLISPLTFTQDDAQFKAVMSQETTVVGMTSLPSVATSLPAADERRAEYVGIAPFAQADGTVITPINPATPQCAFVVTKNCKNPEAAFRLGDLLCSEKYTVMTRWGVEGVDWVKPGNDAVAMYAAMGYAPYLQETGNINWGSPQNQCWVTNSPYIRGYSIPAGMVWNGNPLDSEYLIAKVMPEYIGKGPAEYINKLIYTDEENELIAEPMATIKNYVNESFALFVTGEMDIEKDWDSYLGELNNSGLVEMLTVMQSAYDRMK